MEGGLADLYLQLELPRCGLLELDAAASIKDAGHAAAVDPIAQWLREPALTR